MVIKINELLSDYIWFVISIYLLSYGRTFRKSNTYDYL